MHTSQSSAKTARRTSAWALASATALLLSGCEREQAVTYQIPKEERPTSMPMPSASPAAPAASAGSNGMQVLPGMEAAAQAAGEFQYRAPEGWEDLGANGMRKATLRITDDQGTAELSVLAFPGDVGGRLANINRWRGQIGLDPVDADALPEFVESYTISQHGGLYIRLEGGENSILGGLLPFHGYTWFFKLQGPTATVFAAEAQFKGFLDSVHMHDTAH